MSGFWAQVGQRLARFFLWAFDEHPGKLIGTTLGFILGLLMVTLGFWKTLALVLFVVVGFVLGKRQDENRSIMSWLDRFFR